MSSISGIETESNNSILTADSLVSGSAIKGQLSSRSDYDYYKITASSAGIVAVNFDGPLNSSYDYFKISLIDSSGNILTSQDTGSDTSFSAAVGSAGDYYVIVQDDTFYSSAEYSLTATNITPQAHAHSCACQLCIKAKEENENNNSKVTAENLQIASPIKANLHNSSDLDFFKITTHEKRTIINFNFDVPTETSDKDYFKATLLSGDDNIIATEQSGNNFSLSAILESETDYYLKIEDVFYDSGNYIILADATFL